MISAPTPDRLPLPIRRLLVASAAVSGLFGLILIFSDSGLGELRRIDRETRALDAEIATLQAENARLEKDIAELARPSDRVERIAREELGLMRPGEIVVMLPGRDVGPPPDRAKE